uniref:Uncharacterized protein n=1 Tax=Cacopsylla melanoneura TaxID=428564 RepID=A0A8D8TAY2_9HEMI
MLCTFPHFLLPFSLPSIPSFLFSFFRILHSYLCFLIFSVASSIVTSFVFFLRLFDSSLPRLFLSNVHAFCPSVLVFVLLSTWVLSFSVPSLLLVWLVLLFSASRMPSSSRCAL